MQTESLVGAARQAQFTVRLLLDFLPNDILENFRSVPFDYRSRGVNTYHEDMLLLFELFGSISHASTLFD